jgi:hypothetical protein
VPDHTDSRIIFERNHGHLQKICLAGGGGGWKVEELEHWFRHRNSSVRHNACFFLKRPMPSTVTME